MEFVMTDEPVVTLTKSEIEELITRAVRQTLLEIGIDVSTPSAAKAAQEDMAFLRGWRESTEDVRRHGLKALLTVALGGLGALIWAAIHAGAK
jgi:hypothetical protein